MLRQRWFFEWRCWFEFEMINHFVSKNDSAQWCYMWDHVEYDFITSDINEFSKYIYIYKSVYSSQILPENYCVIKSFMFGRKKNPVISLE